MENILPPRNGSRLLARLLACLVCEHRAAEWRGPSSRESLRWIFRMLASLSAPDRRRVETQWSQTPARPPRGPKDEMFAVSPRRFSALLTFWELLLQVNTCLWFLRILENTMPLSACSTGPELRPLLPFLLLGWNWAVFQDLLQVSRQVHHPSYYLEKVCVWVFCYLPARSGDLPI